MARTLQELLTELDRHDPAIPLDELTAMLESSEISIDDVRAYVRFESQHYARNLMHAGPGYHALILCWRSGQRSPIHDHRGSACGVRVLEGVATETTFRRTSEGVLVPAARRDLGTGQVCGSFDSDIHQMSNDQPDRRDLVTLHIYSPPLLKMGTYSLSDTSVGTFTDPVFEFSEAART